MKHAKSPTWRGSPLRHHEGLLALPAIPVTALLLQHGIFRWSLTALPKRTRGRRPRSLFDASKQYRVVQKEEVAFREAVASSLCMGRGQWLSRSRHMVVITKSHHPMARGNPAPSCDSLVPGGKTPSRQRTMMAKHPVAQLLQAHLGFVTERPCRP